MEKCDWLLISIGEGIEPIQLQKLLFKFAEESEAPQGELYEFEPYNWGPCSFEIYDDLSALRSNDLLEAIPCGRGWNKYRLTCKGKDQVEKLKHSADAKLLKRLDGNYQYVTNRNFGQLLKDVYEDYPEFAKKSLFNK